MAFGPLKLTSLVRDDERLYRVDALYKPASGRVAIVTLTDVLTGVSREPITADRVEEMERVR